MYEGVGNTKGYENEIQYCIPSFSASNLYYLKDSPPPFVFDENNENTKYFFAFDHITDSYAYIDFGGRDVQRLNREANVIHIENTIKEK